MTRRPRQKTKTDRIFVAQASRRFGVWAPPSTCALSPSNRQVVGNILGVCSLSLQALPGAKTSNPPACFLISEDRGYYSISIRPTPLIWMCLLSVHRYGRVPNQTRFLDCHTHEAALARLVRLLPKGAVSKTAMRGVLGAGRRIVQLTRHNHSRHVCRWYSCYIVLGHARHEILVALQLLTHIELVCTSCLPSMGALQVNMYVTGKGCCYHLANTSTIVLGACTL